MAAAAGLAAAEFCDCLFPPWDGLWLRLCLPVLLLRILTPGKPLGSFGCQLEPQNTTNIAWNVLGTFRPRFHGTLGRNFVGICGI